MKEEERERHSKTTILAHIALQLCNLCLTLQLVPQLVPHCNSAHCNLCLILCLTATCASHCPATLQLVPPQVGKYRLAQLVQYVPLPVVVSVCMWWFAVNCAPLLPVLSS